MLATLSLQRFYFLLHGCLGSFPSLLNHDYHDYRSGCALLVNVLLDQQLNTTVSYCRLAMHDYWSSKPTGLPGRFPSTKKNLDYLVYDSLPTKFCWNSRIYIWGLLLGYYGYWSSKPAGLPGRFQNTKKHLDYLVSDALPTKFSQSATYTSVGYCWLTMVTDPVS
jgi:hypothetical protein